MHVFTVLFLFIVAMANLSGVAMEHRRPDLSDGKYQSDIAPNNQWLSRSKRDVVCGAWRICKLMCAPWRCWWKCIAVGGRRKRNLQSAETREVPVALDYNSWIWRCPNCTLDYRCFTFNYNVPDELGSQQAFCGADKDGNGIVSQQEFYEAPWFFEGQEQGAPKALKVAARSLVHRNKRIQPPKKLKPLKPPKQHKPLKFNPEDDTRDEAGNGEVQSQ